MAAIGDFSHRASLPSASLPDYPVKLTKPIGMLTGKLDKIAEHGRRADGIVKSMLDIRAAAAASAVASISRYRPS